MKIFLILLLIVVSCTINTKDHYLPINCANRQDVHLIKLTDIGAFGLLRKARPGIPAHFHTGIDIKRPSNNYTDEPVFPICDGIVISKRTDGPYAQLIIEHGQDEKFWTLYEHIAGIRVDLFEQVNPNDPIARFMNKSELDNYGWQFDHFHFEVLKVEPMKLKVENSKPERLFASYSLVCYSLQELNKCFYDPLNYLSEKLE